MDFQPAKDPEHKAYTIHFREREAFVLYAKRCEFRPEGFEGYEYAFEGIYGVVQKMCFPADSIVRVSPEAEVTCPGITKDMLRYWARKLKD